MKLRKILALVCTLAICVSMIASTALVAEANGATATLEFAGYEVKGSATFAKVVVKASIPDTLVPYELIPADWETTFEDSYKGTMLQGLGFDIPNVEGLAFVASLSSKADYVTITDNKTAKAVQLSYVATGSYDSYYAGEIDTLATLYYRITGDVNATYDIALSNAKVGIVYIDEVSGSATPKEYVASTTAATIQPEIQEEINTLVPSDVAAVTADTIDGEATDYQIGSGLGMTVNAGDAAFTKMKWAISTEAGRLFSKTITFDVPVSGEFKVAATFINGSHENEFGKEVVDSVVFSNVGAIFTDGTADYYTNADDAEYKAE